MDRTEETDLARALRRLDVAGDMAAMDKQTLAEYRDTIRDLRAELAALQAEAREVVGPFARMGDLINRLFDATESRPSLSEYGEHFLAARAFLTSLPSPAVVPNERQQGASLMREAFGLPPHKPAVVAPEYPGPLDAIAPYPAHLNEDDVP